jgi:peptide/nickel transport system substrate-binding protein
VLRAGLWVAEDAPAELGQWLLDPQRFYWHPWHRCCLMRTLLSYEGRPIEDGGAQLRPDLAEGMPDVSADGLRWTFRLTPGLYYAPPFEGREIVARDFIAALERTVRIGESPYYDVIEGVADYRDGSAGTISGVQAPDDTTLVFRLTRAEGDFANRVAMPYLAPLPAEALGAHDDDYGGFLVSSGPYMIEGSDRLDRDDPEAEPLWDLERLVLVRNPSWVAATDRLRPAYVDRIEIVPVPDRDRSAIDAVVDGEIDVLLDPMLSTARDVAASEPALRARLREAPLPSLFFMLLNLAQPPFDDVAVRRAVNAVLDREALLPEFSPERGSAFAPAAHVFPEVAVGGLLRDYIPADVASIAGDADRARELMAESSYDADGDGRCDGAACQVIGNGYGSTTPGALAAIQADLAEIGIEVTWAEGFTAADPSTHVGLTAILGWASDYPSAADFVGLMTDPTLDSFNLSLLGATPEQLATWGYAVTDVPSLDDKIDACITRRGSAAFACWAELDQLMSDQVVAWIPVARNIGAYLISDRVDQFAIAGSEAGPALERISLGPQGDQ